MEKSKRSKATFGWYAAGVANEEERFRIGDSRLHTSASDLDVVYDTLAAHVIFCYY